MKGKKWRDVRNALVMVIVMVAMMSSATFAWFTLTSSPTVTGLQMTAASAGGLKISETGADNTWYDAIALSAEQVKDTNKILSPVSVKKESDNSYLPKFYEPVYLGNKVTSLKDTALNATDESKLSGYVVKYTYYLKSLGEDAKVGILTTNSANYQNGDMGVDSNHQSNLPGSFVRKVDNNDNNSAINAVRIGIVVGGKMYIYEPNYETVENGGNKADNNDNVVLLPVSNIVSTEDGKITTGKGVDDYTSVKLFDLTKDTSTEVDMYIWLEGTDDDCVDEIKADEIQAQIQFTVIE